jgi:hypothetical protein
MRRRIFEGFLSFPELAERIKALRAVNTGEATPQRVRQKHLSAKESVAAGIRRRAESMPASAPPNESDAISAEVAGTPSASAQNSSIKPQVTFRERVAMDRQFDDQGLTRRWIASINDAQITPNERKIM